MIEITSRWKSVADREKWSARAASFVAKAKATKVVWFPPTPAKTGEKAGSTAKKATKTTIGAAKNTTRAAKKSTRAKQTTGAAKKTNGAKKTAGVTKGTAGGAKKMTRAVRGKAS